MRFLVFTLVLLLGWQHEVEAQDWVARCRVAAPIGEAAVCERAIEANPDNPEAHRLLARAYFNGDRIFDSFTAFNDALRLAPRDAGLHFELASYLVLVNEYEAGVTHLQQAVAIDPRHRESWSLLATCYRYMSRAKDAHAATLKAALLGDPIEAYALARFHAEGTEGSAPDPQSEKLWLQKSARAGHVQAMQDLADLYDRGRPGMAAEPDKARYWKDRIARLNLPGPR